MIGLILLSGLLPATPAAERPRIEVGPTIRVSAANSGRLHHEVTMAASSTDPGKLLACSMIFEAKDASRHVIAYRSTDGGASWTPTLEVNRTNFVGDPACAFGSDGAAYVAALALSPVASPDHEMLVYRSTDGGSTWSDPTVLPFIDREWLVVDRTSGTRRGTLYLHGNAVRDRTVDGDERIVFTFYRSTDGGATFSAPKKLLPDGEHMSFGTGTSVVLSDGTFVASFPEWSDRKNIVGDDFKKPDGSIKIVRSKDGGDSFSKAVTVAEWHGCQGWTPGLPVLAVDASSGPFRDRLYVTWPDRRSGRCEILLAYSADKGDTWSKPAVINDDQSPADRDRSRDHMLPAVAVNPSGVLGISWSDRRDSADNVLGWAARFSASRDGGETFTPSVRLSDPVQGKRDEPYIPIMAHSEGGGHRRPRGRGGNIRMEIGPQWIDFLCAADTAGIAAGADGAFHPLWVDHRTGVPQLWTAAVRVEGEALLNGSPDLAELADLTQSVAVDFANTDYDAKERIVSLDVVLTNTSEKAISVPLKLRVISLKSSSAVPEILDGENRLPDAGAVWDFTPQLPEGRLAPGQSSRARRVRFKLSQLGAFKLDKRGGLGSLVSVETKVLGKEEPR
ncbi:MAG: sialidase family protein [Thermoanaerobaculia bacterium]